MSSSDPRISHAKLQAPSPSRIDDMNYGMPDFKRVLTTIDDKGQSIFVQANDSRRYCDRGGYSVTFNYVTGEFPLGMQGDIDLEGFLTNDPRSPTSYIHTGKRIVNDHGMTFNTINFGPGVQTSMHRTVSVDFIAVIEGDVALELDSGESQHLATGDVVVQRQTMHRWRNPSTDKPARMIAVISPAKPIKVDGKELGQEGFSIDGMGSKAL